MSHKNAEKLIILRQHGEALLERLYSIRDRMRNPTMKPFVFREGDPAIPSDKLSKFFKFLQRDYPNFPDNIENQIGYDYVKSTINELLHQLQPFYQTFREMLDWFEHAQRSLEEVTSTSNVDFKFELNIPILEDFFSVMVVYVKQALLLNRIEERKTILSLFNLAHAKVNGTQEPAVPKVAKMFQDLLNPFGRVQEVFFTVQNHVGRALLNLWSSFDKGDYSYLTSKRPLEMLSEPDKIVYPSVEQVYMELTFHDKIVEWILYGYMCCPEGLALSADGTSPAPVTAKGAKAPAKAPVPTNRGLNLLYKALGDHYVLPIYGDETLSLQEPFEDIFLKFKSTTIVLKKEKKVLKTVMEEAPPKAQANHRDKRNYLRLHLGSLLNMLKDNPGLLGPKFQLVLASLSLAKAEILWYFRHLGVAPKYKPKLFKEEKEERIGELIYLMDEVFRVCLKHKDTIASYNLELIRKLYAKRVRELVTQSSLPFEGQNSVVIEAIISDLQNSTQFMATRLNWKRLQVFLSGYQFKNYMKDNSIVQLFATLNKVYEFTRHIDDIDRELVEIGSLKELYFYQKEIKNIFKEGLENKGTQPLYSMSFVRILQYYADNIDKALNPDIRERVGREAVSLAEYMLTLLSKHIVKNLIDLRGPLGHAQLANQVGGDKVAARLKARILKQKEPMLPGAESTYAAKQTIEEMRTIERSLTQLLYALSSHEEVQIYDTMFYPTEYLRDKLEDYCGEFVKAICQAVDSTNVRDVKPMEFLAPSVVLNELRLFARTVKIIEQCCNINTEEIVMASFVEHLTHLDNTASPYISEVSGEKVNVVKDWARWYGEVVNQVTELKILYSPLRQSFISRPDVPALTYKFEEYLDPSETDALAELVGAYGIRVFDQELLKHIYAGAEKLRDTLSQNHTALKDLEQNIYSDTILDVARTKFNKNIENILTYCIKLGGLLTFRNQLRASLRLACERNVPIISNLMKSLQEQYPENLFKDEKLFLADALASDAGVVSFGADNALKTALAPLCAQSIAWESLPTAFAVLLTQPTIANTPYDVYLEGWPNNTHLAITAFNELIIASNSIKVKTKDVIEREFYRFQEIAAQILLNMRLSKTFNDKQVQAAYVFADKVIKASPYVRSSMFEEMNPYPIVRNVYISVYEPTAKAAQVPGKPGAVQPDVVESTLTTA